MPLRFEIQESTLIRVVLYRWGRAGLLKRGFNIAVYFELWRLRTRIIILDEYYNSPSYLTYKYIMLLFRTSAKHRSAEEMASIWAFAKSALPCLPHEEMSEIEINKFCEEIEILPPVDYYSILFLQGDVGHCYYIVAHGAVGLYLEKDPSKLSKIGQTYGIYRLRKFPGPEKELNALGDRFLTLPTGAGFGEGALLSREKKSRMCAAATTVANTIVLTLNETAYNLSLRRHHFEKHNFSLATAMLRKLPQFEQYAYSQIAHIAMNMQMHTIRIRTVLVRAGQPIKDVYFISSGAMKVLQPTAPQREVGQVLPSVYKRIPSVAVAVLGFGIAIGEREMQLGQKTYQYTYVADSSTVELFSMSTAMFEVYVSGSSLRSNRVYKRLERQHDEVDKARGNIVQSSQAVINEMMLKKATDLVMLESFLLALPLIDVNYDPLPSPEEDASPEFIATPMQSSLKGKQDKAGKPKKTAEDATVSLGPVPPDRSKMHSMLSPKQKAINMYKQMLKDA